MSIIIMMTPILLPQELDLLRKIPFTLSNRLEDRLEEVVSFSGTHKNLCVGIVDMVGSTKVSAHLSKEKMTKYYSIFLNGMAMIAKDHGASVVKSIGDSLLYYFPKTADIDSRNFVCPIKCGISMIDCSEIINSKMSEHGLPPASYRISMDFGTVMLASSVSSSTDDIFGSTVNICSKINRMAEPNEMIIGHDMYQIVKNFDEYSFNPISDYSLGLLQKYPVFSVSKK